MVSGVVGVIEGGFCFLHDGWLGRFACVLFEFASLKGGNDVALAGPGVIGGEFVFGAVVGWVVLRFP